MKVNHYVTFYTSNPVLHISLSIAVKKEEGKKSPPSA